MPRWLDNLRANAKAATSRPWGRNVRRAGNGWPGSQSEEICSLDRDHLWLLHDGSEEGNANAQHIADANPRTLLWLLEMLELAGGAVRSDPRAIDWLERLEAGPRDALMDSARTRELREPCADCGGVVKYVAQSSRLCTWCEGCNKVRGPHRLDQRGPE